MAGDVLARCVLSVRAGRMIVMPKLVNIPSRKSHIVDGERTLTSLARLAH